MCPSEAVQSARSMVPCGSEPAFGLLLALAGRMKKVIGLAA